MYYVIVVPPTGRVISLLINGMYETDKLVEYYTELGCQVSIHGVN